MEAPAGPALADPATAAALGRYRRRAAWLLAVGVGVVGLGAALGALPVSSGVAGTTTLIGVGLAAAGLATVVRGARFGRALARHPWTAHGATYWPMHGGGALLLDDEPDGVHLTAIAHWRLHLLVPCDGATVWTAPLGYRSIVATAPPAAALVLLVRPRLAATRRRYARWATAVVDPDRRRRVLAGARSPHVVGRELRDTLAVAAGLLVALLAVLAIVELVA